MAELHYVATGYVASGYYQTGISLDWAAKIIHVPVFFLNSLGGSNYTLDTTAFMRALSDIEDSEAGVVHPKMFNHNTQLTLGGIVYARAIEIINGYTVTFEDTGTPYKVFLIGSNNNILDVTNLNNVSVSPGNSAGLQIVSTPTNVVTGTALTAEQTANAVWGAATRTLTSLGMTPEQIAAAILAAAQTTPIHGNMVQTNGQALIGDGTEGNKFRSHLVP